MTQTINSEGQASPAGASPAVFNNPEFGSVRVIMKEDGEPLFCLRDVATCLGYANPSSSVNDICYDGYAILIPIKDSLGRTQEAKFGPESEVYRLIFGSKLESAKKFQDWVFKDVLPSIRKTGSYSVAQQSYQLPQNYVEALEALVASEKEKLLLLDQNNDQKHIIKQQSDMIDVLLPKAQAYEDQMSDEGWFTGSEAAKQLRGAIFQSGRTDLYEFLREKGIFNKSGRPIPSEKYLDAGWFKVVRKDVPHAGKVPVTLFSQKGIDQIYSMLVDGEMKKYIVGLFVGSI